MKLPYKNGLTLIELLVVVALIGILTAFGIPIYRDYENSAEILVAKECLLAMDFTQKHDFFEDNREYYYSTGRFDLASSQNTKLINKNLFNGKEVCPENDTWMFSSLKKKYSATTTLGYRLQAHRTQKPHRWMWLQDNGDMNATCEEAVGGWCRFSTTYGGTSTPTCPTKCNP